MKIKSIITESANKLDDPKEYARALAGFESYFDEEGRIELIGYNHAVNKLIKNGGKVYRVIFANSPAEVKQGIKDGLNKHWTWCEAQIFYSIDNLWSNYGSGKDKAYVLIATVPPNSISNVGVDISGNPEEQEVNIVANYDQVKLELMQVRHKQVVPVYS